VLNWRCSGCKQGYQATTQSLFERDAEVDAPSGKYGNALQAASFEGNMKVVQLLLEKGAEVNALGGEYDIAFHAASFRGQT
jgi:hypothetical protein